MGLIRTPKPVKLFVGMLSSEPALFDECAALLSASYGAIDYESTPLPWEVSDYYREEMGSSVYRKFIFFRELIDPVRLAGIKNSTNALEAQFSGKTPSGSRRRINLDPGYVAEAKIVLASTKDYSHRVYIGENIYAEVTLRYSSKERSFTALDHTYLDFRTKTYQELFNMARDLLRKALHRK